MKQNIKNENKLNPNISELNTNPETGLTSQEVLKNRELFGENILKTHKKINPFIAFLNQFKDFMIILLLIAACASISVTIWEHVSGHLVDKTDKIIAYTEPAIILLVVVLNSMLGAYQEVKSDQAVRALEKINEQNAKVLRDGRVQNIPAVDIVPGDILIVEAGDTISADAKLIQSFNLMTVESSLTGESVPVSKDFKFVPQDEKIIAEQKNKIFSGTYVTNGRGVAIVYATGKGTVIGQINKMIQEEEQQITPLQIKLNKLSKIFGYSGIALLFLSLIIQVLLSNSLTGDWAKADVYTNSLITSISLAVAAIPEGLIPFTTVILAIGVSWMAKNNAIVKNLPAIEALGSTNVICSDKTGTLTQNKMVVQNLFYKNHLLKDDNSKTDFNELVKKFILCSDAEVHWENNKFEEVGDPTETGVLIYGYEKGIVKSDLFQTYKKIGALPFDSDRKMMSVLIEMDTHNLLITKGAPDVIFSRLTNSNDQAVHVNEEWSNQAYRVLAVATKKLPKSQNSISLDDENNFDFEGLVALIDPPREEVKTSILEAKNAGIKTVMITGDHLTTAVAIGKQLGIYNDSDLVITGAQLAQMSQEELINQVQSISIYARVNPEDKLRIVKAWQHHNKVVAMTGDGVNDAPALKASDIGCAMGITGTDVSKQAANVILTDDNFSTITKAVKSGREIYDKIKTVVLNLLISSITEIIVMLVGLFAFRFIFKDSIGQAEFWILSASQLLWINLLTHGLPAIALGMVHSGDNVMNRAPYSKNETIFSRGMGTNLIIQSVTLSILSLVSYGIVGMIAQQNNIQGVEFIKLTSTACFVTMGIGASLSSLNLMSKKNLILCSFKQFYLVYLASVFSLFCVLAAAYIPGLNSVFKMFTGEYIAIYIYIPILLGLGLIMMNEVIKVFNNFILKK